MRELLERDQQVITPQRAGTGYRTEHRQEERVDVRFVGRGVLEEQQGQRAAVHPTQVGGVLVELVIELFGGGLDAPPGFLIDQRAAAQRTRHRRLGNPGQVGDVDGCGFYLHLQRDPEAFRLRPSDRPWIGLR
jgi:hypothetical protein